MSARDGRDDGQAQSGAAPSPCHVGAREALERLMGEAVGESGALVAHVELEVIVAPPGIERDVAAPVTQGVVDHVAERLLETEGIGGDREGVGRLDLDAPPA